MERGQSFSRNANEDTDDPLALIWAPASYVSLCLSNHLSVLPELKHASKIHLSCTAHAVL